MHSHHHKPDIHHLEESIQVISPVKQQAQRSNWRNTENEERERMDTKRTRNGRERDDGY